MGYETALRIVGRIRDHEVSLPGITDAQIKAEPGDEALGCGAYSVKLLVGRCVVARLYTPQHYTDYVNARYR